MRYFRDYIKLLCVCFVFMCVYVHSRVCIMCMYCLNRVCAYVQVCIVLECICVYLCVLVSVCAWVCVHMLCVFTCAETLREEVMSEL